MREIGALFQPSMVIALQREVLPKTQTRRIAKFVPIHEGLNLSFSGLEPVATHDGSWVLTSRGAGTCWEERTKPLKCPYGKAGDRLYVREAWRAPKSLDHLSGSGIADACCTAGYESPWCPIVYLADDRRNNKWEGFGDGREVAVPGRYRHGRFMPRWASRITLEVTSTRIERLLAISEEDAIAEGTRCWICEGPVDGSSENDCACFHTKAVARESYRALWEEINGAGSWDRNPFVWRVAFRRVQS